MMVGCVGSEDVKSVSLQISADAFEEGLEIGPWKGA